MTLSEMATIIGIIQEIWPNWLSVRNIVRTTEIWHELFDTETPSELTNAIQAYACRDTKGFPPPIGALKELVWQQRNEHISEQTAWEMVKKQLSGSSAHPQENFEKLPAIVQQCVGSPSTLMQWGQMDENALESVIGSNFKRHFREKVVKQREYDVLPKAIKPKFAETMIALPDCPKEPERLEEPNAHHGRGCPPEVWAKIQSALSRTEEDSSGAIRN